MLSMTDCAFSWPISGRQASAGAPERAEMQRTEDPTLVIVEDVPLVVSPAVVCFSHGHGIVCEVDIAVVACSDRSEVGGEVEVASLQKSAKVSVLLAERGYAGSPIFWHGGQSEALGWWENREVVRTRYSQLNNKISRSLSESWHSAD